MAYFIKVALLFLILTVGLSAAVVCREPSLEDLTQLKSTLPEYLYINSHSPYGDPVPNDDRCPSRRSLMQQGAMNTVCPSYNFIESDLDRIPVNISQTRCLCRHCLVGQNNMCHAIHRQLPVLRKSGTCRNGEVVYNVEMQQVAVGCICLPRRNT